MDEKHLQVEKDVNTESDECWKEEGWNCRPVHFQFVLLVGDLTFWITEKDLVPVGSLYIEGRVGVTKRNYPRVPEL